MAHSPERRPIWRGLLRLALVSCPVALYATKHERSNLHFHFINPKTGNRVRTITRDAETDEDVTRGNLVKGYEFKKDHYLLLDDEDFASARTESSSVMKIEKFVEQGSINPIYFDSSYYIAPDGDGGEDVFVVLREAIKRSGMAALTRIVVSHRERVVLLTLIENGLVAHTLHEADDLYDPSPLFAGLHADKPDADMVKLAEELIKRQTGTYDPADFEDRYEKRLRAVIDAKLKGEGVEPEVDEPDRSNVVDLMSALRQSLGQSDTKAEKPKKAAAPKAAPKTAPKRKAK